MTGAPEHVQSARLAFSYIEMLVSLVIMMILYAIMLGPGSRGVQEKRKAECSRQLQQLYMSLNAYASDHEGRYPFVSGATMPSEPLNLLVPKYTSDTALFICPGSGDSALPGGQPIAKRHISYAYYMGVRADAGAQWPVLSDAQLNAEAKKKGERIFASKNEHPGNNHRSFGGNILFGDGHVEASEGEAPADLDIPTGGTLLNP